MAKDSKKISKLAIFSLIFGIIPFLSILIIIISDSLGPFGSLAEFFHNTFFGGSYGWDSLGYFFIYMHIIPIISIILSVVFGIISLIIINKNKALRGKGFAAAGLILSALAILTMILMFIPAPKESCQKYEGFCTFRSADGMLNCPNGTDWIGGTDCANINKDSACCGHFPASLPR